jgi:hypothetical protein
VAADVEHAGRPRDPRRARGGGHVGTAAIYGACVRHYTTGGPNSSSARPSLNPNRRLGGCGPRTVQVMDTPGLEPSAPPESIQGRAMTLAASLIARCRVAVLVVDGLHGTHPEDAAVRACLTLPPPVSSLVACKRCRTLSQRHHHTRAALCKPQTVGV